MKITTLITKMLYTIEEEQVLYNRSTEIYEKDNRKKLPPTK